MKYEVRVAIALLARSTGATGTCTMSRRLEAWSDITPVLIRRTFPFAVDDDGARIILKTAVHPRQPRPAPMFTPPRAVLRNHPLGDVRSSCAAQWNWAFRAVPAFPTAGFRIMEHTHASTDYQWAGWASFVAWRATIFQPLGPFTHT